jgi:cysteine desulfurase
VHVDATQAIGSGTGSWAGLPAATLTLAPHKFGGPRGIGGLVIRGGVALAAVADGPQEGGLRGGTEPVMLAVGFARALELAVAERHLDAARLAELRERFEEGLARVASAAGVTTEVIGRHVPRAPHISTIAFATVAGRWLDRQAIVMAADLEGLCAATGTACASGSSEPAAALLAMGLPEPVVQAAVRFSFGRDTSPDTITEALARLGRVLTRMAESCPGGMAG